MDLVGDLLLFVCCCSRALLVYLPILPSPSLALFHHIMPSITLPLAVI
jgi:hypothetical protein